MNTHNQNSQLIQKNKTKVHNIVQYKIKCPRVEMANNRIRRYFKSIRWISVIMLNWTELNKSARLHDTFIGHADLSCTSHWLAAAKLGRLVLG